MHDTYLDAELHIIPDCWIIFLLCWHWWILFLTYFWGWSPVCCYEFAADIVYSEIQPDVCLSIYMVSGVLCYVFLQFDIVSSGIQPALLQMFIFYSGSIQFADMNLILHHDSFLRDAVCSVTNIYGWHFANDIQFGVNCSILSMNDVIIQGDVLVTSPLLYVLGNSNDFIFILLC